MVLAPEEDEPLWPSPSRHGSHPALGKRGKLTLALFNYVAPLQEAGQKGTKEPHANGITG